MTNKNNVDKRTELLTIFKKKRHPYHIFTLTYSYRANEPF